MHRQPILDPVLIQSVSVLQDLPGKDQNQLILFGFKPPGNLFFELKNKKKKNKNKQSTRQANGGGQESEGKAPGITGGPRRRRKEPAALQHLTKKEPVQAASSVASC